jgi:hypothetical protein
MANNENLHNAKRAKNDEFYTQLIDIEKELKYYKNFFKGKKVLCNCNDDKWSAFFKYFSMNFEHLGLKQLVCVSYNEKGHGKKYTYNGDLNGNRMVDDWEVNVTELNGNGSYSSDECVELLKECDVVVTNPPFSLFRDFVALLMQYNKKFLIIGNGNAVTYKEIFPLIKENKMWMGVTLFTGKMPFFRVPTEYLESINNDRYEVREDGVYKQVNVVAWFTNIPHDKRNQPLDLFKKYNPTEYPKYDNYDAIECSKTANIPMDYDGVIGVPITFLDKYCPTQFEIVGLDRYVDGNTMPNKRMHIDGKEIYARILIKKLSE